ncbi:hypothetical protein [Microbacterium sp. P05]|uniref:hypothetical protein n=1 Tax=Microbacterium sp. P05 TaxID=3366948 RepID=UPI003746DF8E
MTSVITFLLVAVPSGAAWSSTTQDSPVTWSVAPADANGPDGRGRVEIALDPGATVTEHLAVRNLSETDTTFSLTAADGYYTSSGRFDMLAAGEQSIDAGTWITVEPSVTIAAGKTAVVPYTITVPTNATPGDHAAGVAASVLRSATDADGTQIGVDSRVGFRVSTRVTGDLAPALAVTDVRAEYTPSWSLFSPGRVAVTYTASNTGNATLGVRDRVGDAASEHGNLLPGETRAITVEPVDAWPLGLLFLGFTVEGSVADDAASAAPFTDTLVLWAVPWLHLLAALGILLILLAILTGRRRTRQRMQRLLDEAREAGRRDATELVHTS